MQYVYFCPSCNNLECHNSDNLSLECAECGKKLISLKVDMDTWNDLSNDEMVSLIDKARNSGLKKPVFKPEPEPEDTDFDVYDVPKNKHKGKTQKKRNKLLIPLIILVVVLVLGAVAVVIYLTQNGSSAAGDSSEETVAEVPKETVELTKDNFLKYFDVTTTCGSKVQENQSRDFLGFYSFDFSSDMTITIKARKPLQCENCYVSLNPHVENIGNYSITDDEVDNIKLEPDGYNTTTKKIHMNGYPFATFEFYVYDRNLEVKNASGTITFDEGTFTKETDPNTTTQAQ